MTDSYPDPNLKRWPLYVIAFLDLFAVSLIVPIIKTHLLSLGASYTITGLISSVYGFVQLFSSPLIGKWADVSGKKYVLILTLILSAFGYVAFGISTSLWIVILSRLPVGLFKHTQTLVKADMADISSGPQQSLEFGRLNAASAAGFIIGPTIGGHLAHVDNGFFIVTTFAASIFVTNAIFAWFFLPNDLTKGHNHKKTNNPLRPSMSDTDDEKQLSLKLNRVTSTTSMKQIHSDELSFNPRIFMQSFAEIRWSEMWDMFLTKALVGLALIMFRGNFTVTMQQKYGIDTITNGYLVSYSGIVGMASGILVGPVSKWYRHDHLRILIHFTILEIFVLIALCYAPSVFYVAALLTPLGLCNQLGRVTTSSLIVIRAQSDDTGALMGLSQSTMSLSRMLAPLIAGLVTEYSIDGPAYVGICFMTVSVFILIFYSRRYKVHSS